LGWVTNWVRGDRGTPPRKSQRKMGCNSQRQNGGGPPARDVGVSFSRAVSDLP
jgi:hypothetical protein